MKRLAFENKTYEAVATVRVGETTTRRPITILGHSDRPDAFCEAMRGKVVYVHPKGRFHVVEFPSGWRESFVGIER